MSFSAEEDGGGMQLNGDSGSRGMLASGHLFCSETKPQVQEMDNCTLASLPGPSPAFNHHLQSMQQAIEELALFLGLIPKSHSIPRSHSQSCKAHLKSLSTYCNVY